LTIASTAALQERNTRFFNPYLCCTMLSSTVFACVRPVVDRIWPCLTAILQDRNTGGFNPDMDEELEDAQGNVYSRKVYEDLKRQGLL
jgi:splicing factor 3A subunit 3